MGRCKRAAEDQADGLGDALIQCAGKGLHGLEVNGPQRSHFGLAEIVALQRLLGVGEQSLSELAVRHRSTNHRLNIFLSHCRSPPSA